MDKLDKDSIYYCKTILAGKKIEIESRSKNVLAFFRGYLSRYDTPDFVARASQEDIQRELRMNFSNKLSEAEDIAVECVNAETSAIYGQIAEYLLGFNTILLHGAAISVDNKCYIFIAPSGTGKTTHIRNWLKGIPGTIVVNGDKPLINVETKIVYGTPWSGKEGLNTNISVPLAGIINLERGKTNEITPVTFKEMLPYLLQQTYMPIATKEKLLTYHHLGELKDVPFYKLKCNMNIESAITTYQGIMNYERGKNG